MALNKLSKEILDLKEQVNKPPSGKKHLLSNLCVVTNMN